eukprot:3209161-Rhodomonas_salina.1
MQRANNVLLVLLVCLALAQACSCWRSCGLNAYTKSPCRFPRRIGVELVLRGGEDELQHDDLSDMVEYGVEDFQDVIAALKQKLQSGVPSRHDFRNALCVCLSSASKGSATLSHAMELLRFMKAVGVPPDLPAFQYCAEILEEATIRDRGCFEDASEVVIPAFSLRDSFPIIRAGMTAEGIKPDLPFYQALLRVLSTSPPSTSRALDAIAVVCPTNTTKSVSRIVGGDGAGRSACRLGVFRTGIFLRLCYAMSGTYICQNAHCPMPNAYIALQLSYAMSDTYANHTAHDPVMPLPGNGGCGAERSERSEGAARRGRGGRRGRRGRERIAC